MKKSLKISIFLLSFISILLFPNKPLVVLSEVLKPNNMIFSEKNIYITEKYIIHIYDRKTYKFKKSFGKKGQGPGEISGRSIVNVYKKNLVITDRNKILWFTENGEFIKEKREDKPSFAVFPVKGGYVKYILDSNYMKKTASLRIELFDDNFKLKQILYEKIKKNVII